MGDLSTSKWGSNGNIMGHSSPIGIMMDVGDIMGIYAAQ